MTCAVSWLVLERYALGELPGSEQAEIRSHVADCARCQRLLRSIEEDRRPMPELRLPGRRRWVPLVAGGLALAAAALIVALPRPAPPPAHRHVKGGELAIAVVRERGGDVQEDPAGFLEGDRLRVRVTCPPGERSVRVEVVQDEQTELLEEAVVRCGNLVPVGPAFGLTGGRASICATVDRETVCRTLEPIRD